MNVNIVHYSSIDRIGVSVGVSVVVVGISVVVTDNGSQRPVSLFPRVVFGHLLAGGPTTYVATLFGFHVLP